MLSWLAGRLLGYVMARLRAGDIRPTLMLDHPDVTLTFPGRNSWSGVYHGRDQVKAWLERFSTVGLQIFPDEVVAAGPPWRSTVCVRGHIHLHEPGGRPAYENRYVIWGHLRWGRMYEYEVYEDTISGGELDEYLRDTAHPAARPGPALSGSRSSG